MTSSSLPPLIKYDLEAYESNDLAFGSAGGEIEINIQRRQIEVRKYQESSFIGGEDILRVEKDLTHHKVLRFWNRRDAITLCFKNHSDRDGCSQLINSFLNHTMWVPSSRSFIEGIKTTPKGDELILVTFFTSLDSWSGTAPTEVDSNNLIVFALPELYSDDLKGIQQTYPSPEYSIIIKEKHSNISSVIILLAPNELLHSIGYIDVGELDSFLVVSLRIFDTSFCIVNSHLEMSPSSREFRKRFKYLCQLMSFSKSNPELDLCSQFNHLFLCGIYDGLNKNSSSPRHHKSRYTLREPSLTSSILSETDMQRTGGILWKNIERDSAGSCCLEYTGTTAVFEINITLPLLLPKYILPHTNQGTLSISIDRVELHSKSLPSVSRAALVFYPSGPFSSFYGSGIKQLTPGAIAWGSDELPTMAVVNSSRNLEYLSRQVLFVALRDVDGDSSSNLIGAAAFPLGDISLKRSFDVAASYNRFDQSWGEMYITISVQDSESSQRRQPQPPQKELQRRDIYSHEGIHHKSRSPVRRPKRKSDYKTVSPPPPSVAQTPPRQPFVSNNNYYGGFDVVAQQPQRGGFNLVKHSEPPPEPYQPLVVGVPRGFKGSEETIIRQPSSSPAKMLLYETQPYQPISPTRRSGSSAATAFKQRRPLESPEPPIDRHYVKMPTSSHVSFIGSFRSPEPPSPESVILTETGMDYSTETPSRPLTPFRPLTPVENKERVPVVRSIRVDSRGRLGVVLSPQLEVTSVVDGSGSDLAGITAGMIVCKLGSTIVSTPAEYFSALAIIPPGSTVDVVLSTSLSNSPQSTIPPADEWRLCPTPDLHQSYVSPSRSRPTRRSS